MKKLILFIFILAQNILFSQHSTILLIDGFLHKGNGETIEHALIGIKKGIIVEVGNSLTTRYNKKDWDTIISLEGQHIYPGFVATNSTLGLTEIDAVRATRDFNETGEFNPHVRSQIAFNPESKVVSTVLTNGVLLCQATPRGGMISGSSAIMSLSGWNWEDATVLANDGIHVNWPSSLEGGGWWAEPAPKKRNENYINQKKEIESFFQLAEAYMKGKINPLEEDQRLEAMRGCFFGTKRVYFHANEMQQILDIISFSSKYKLKFPVIVGGYEAHLVGQRLKDATIPILVQRIHSLPENEDDPIDQPFKIPFLLKKEGVLFGIQNAGDMEAMNTRNLPFQAGTATAYGISEEEAIQSISLDVCKIIGIGEKYGSVEVGKSATLFASKGNALEMKSNQVSLIIINGNFVSTTNFQYDLYKKYTNKLEH
jgi:hypothetical protein